MVQAKTQRTRQTQAIERDTLQLLNDFHKVFIGILDLEDQFLPPKHSSLKYLFEKASFFGSSKLQSYGVNEMVSDMVEFDFLTIIENNFV